MIKITRSRLGLLAVVGMLVVGLSQGRPMSAAPVSVATPVANEACLLWCVYEPWYCASGQHDAFTSDTPTTSGLNHNGQVCWSGTCGEPLHPYCEPEEGGNQTLESLRLAVLHNDSQGLKKLLAQHQSVTVNRARSAIQMTACDQSIAFHLPIPASLLGAL